MPKPTDARICDAVYSTESIDYRAPMKFGGRVVSDVALLNVTVTLETRDGRRAQGFGSMPMGNVWAWPSAAVATADTLVAMIELGKRCVDAAMHVDACGHPLELTEAIGHRYAPLAETLTNERRLAEPMPRLAQLVAASPLEAAIYDAYGKALEENVYRLLGAEFVNRDLGAYLGAEFAGEFLDRYTLANIKPRMPLYHLVGALDPLTPADAAALASENPQLLEDGLPIALPDWVAADGLTHLKIKLNGDDLTWDVERVAAIEGVVAPAQQGRGVRDWNYSLDFNERCASVDYVLEFLARLQDLSPEAMRRVQYIEQPTHRDLRGNPENRMHAAAKIKPVVIDESLVDFESLLLAREQGYSGVALKACKGQSEALLMGAAAQKFGMFLCVQDLTCPGASFLHSATLAARIPTVAAIEGNGRQYCPRGNATWSERYPTMFELTDGTVETAVLDGPGLGF